MSTGVFENVEALYKDRPRTNAPHSDYCALRNQFEDLVKKEIDLHKGQVFPNPRKGNYILRFELKVPMLHEVMEEVQ